MSVLKSAIENYTKICSDCFVMNEKIYPTVGFKQIASGYFCTATDYVDALDEYQFKKPTKFTKRLCFARST